MQHLCRITGGIFLTAVWSVAALAQRPVHGTVTDLDTGSPVADVRVSVKGTRVATATTAAGRFTLVLPDSGVTLEARRIGYQPGLLSVTAGQSEVDIKLKATALQLGEMVVTGQATTISRQNAANDVSSVSAVDLTRTHAQTIENALQGKVPGALITSNSGAPGGGLQVRMRGVNSVFGNSQPLYVIDGVVVSNSVVENGLNAATQAGGGLNSSNQDNGVNRIADLNPTDVQTVDFLPGPSAAAIYGSQAANGVVIITTKHGQPGPARFSVTQRMGTNAQSNTLGLRHFTLPDAIAFSKAYGVDSSTVKQWFQQDGGYEDFEKMVYGDKSLSYETDVSASGGGENTQFYVSALAQHDNGIMYGTFATKQGLRANLTQLVGSKLQLKVNMGFIHSLDNRGISNNDNVNVTPYFVIGETPSFFPMQPTNGVYPVNPFTFGSGDNLLQTLAQFQVPEDVFRFTGSVNASYALWTTPRQSLKAVLDAGIDVFHYKANIYAPATLYWEQGSLPGLASDLSASEAVAPVALTVAHTYSPESDAFQATTSVGTRSGFDYLSTDNVVTQNLLAGQQNVDRGTAQSVFENRARTRQLSLFGQEELLLFSHRLYLSGGILAQKSTNNADVNKLYYFPKASGSFRWPELGPFQELKLRAAFGETGNEPLYGQKFTTFTGLTYTGSNALALSGTLADPNLHPERSREIELGLDAGLYNSRIAFSATIYQKNTTDLILQQALAPSQGFGTRIFNGGEIRNRGVDASVIGFPVRTRDLSWQARVTFYKNAGRVMSLPVPAFRPPNSFGFAYGSGFIKVGASPSQIYGHTDTLGTLGTVGDYEPDFAMGFSSDVSYKSLELYGLLDWRHGGDVVNITQNLFDALGLAPDVAASNVRNTLFNGGSGQSVYVQDASFVKLRDVTLSYALPAHLVQSLFGSNVSGVRAELSGHNLVTWTPYKGLDPEVSNFGIQNINRGQDLAPYPPSRSYFFTLSVDF